VRAGPWGSWIMSEAGTWFGADELGCVSMLVCYVRASDAGVGEMYQVPVLACRRRGLGNRTGRDCCVDAAAPF
jgi:hypothetical protein